jgi:hypothetical protein
MTVKAAKMKLKLSIIRNVYLHPSTFIENAWTNSVNVF